MMLCLMPSEAGFVACAWHHVVCWEAAGWRPLIAVPPVEAAARLVGWWQLGSSATAAFKATWPATVGSCGGRCASQLQELSWDVPELVHSLTSRLSLSRSSLKLLQHQLQLLSGDNTLLLAALTFDFRTPCICLLSFYSFKILSLGACYCRYSLPFPDDSKFQLFCCKFEPNFGRCWITGNCCTIPFFYSGADLQRTLTFTLHTDTIFTTFDIPKFLHERNCNILCHHPSQTTIVGSAMFISKTMTVRSQQGYSFIIFLPPVLFFLNIRPW